MITFNSYDDEKSGDGWQFIDRDLETAEEDYEGRHCRQSSLKILFKIKRITGSVQRAFIIGPMMVSAVLNTLVFILHKNHQIMVLMTSLLSQILHGGFLMLMMPPAPISGFKIGREVRLIHRYTVNSLYFFQ